ncbi:SDR family oxidoreductase [Oceanobacillus kapialis]|uniref:SDR family oxidoreductase n=1 Tax=Oceanobacillus kapialis TaxID=481353 RepID=A0ABW5PW40_9BACI
MNEEKGKEIAEDIGDKALFVKHDVTDEEQWKNVVKQTEEKFGPVNGLVNNAGFLEAPEPIETQTVDTFRKAFDINAVSTFLRMKSVIPSMKKNEKGSIVNISSISGLMGVPNQVAYVSSKYAIRGMTKSAAHELGKHNIRVNSVHPGVVKTAMIASEGFKEAEQAVTAQMPLGRIQTAEELSNMILFLLSDESNSSTGAEFVVDGGLTS